MKKCVNKLHSEVLNILLEAPGTLPDLPGWILGHPIVVEQKSTVCRKCPCARLPTRLQFIVCLQCSAEINIQQTYVLCV